MTGTGVAAITVLGAALGGLLGTLMAITGRPPETRPSPWPYVVGVMVLAGLLALVGISG